MIKKVLVVTLAITLGVLFILLQPQKQEVVQNEVIAIPVPILDLPQSKNIPGKTFTSPTGPEVQNSVKKVKQFKLDADRTIEIYGEIGTNAVNASILLARLNAQSSRDITIVLDSPGGSVIDGARLISAMQSSRSKIKTVCLSLCASMAFMIHQYGDERLALDRAILMAHPASGGARGNVDSMLNQLTTIQRYINKMEAEVSNRMGISFLEYKNRTSQELWIDSEDAVKEKLVDGLIDISMDIPSVSDSFNVEQKTKTEKHFDFIWIMPGYVK